MKKQLLTMFTALLCWIVGTTFAMADTQVIYSWESPDGTPVEVGGKAEGHSYKGDVNRLNYSNKDAAGNSYYSMCLNGKKGGFAEVAVPAADDNNSHIHIKLDKALAAGDQISITGYRNKGDNTKMANAFIFFKEGVTIADANAYNDLGYGGLEAYAPSTFTFEVPEAAAGIDSMLLTRNSSSTNLFITKLEITRENDETDDNPSPFLFDWATKVGTYTLQNVTEEAVKCHKNTYSINGLRLANSIKIEEGVPSNYVLITPSDGIFMAGDTLIFAGAYNNSSEKASAIAVFDDQLQKLYTSKQFINGRLVDDDPVIEKYILEANTSALYIGRDGATTTYVTLLSVVRDTNGSSEPETPARSFVDFAIDFRTNPFTGTLPEGVSLTNGSFNDGQHGYANVALQVPVDGPVAFKIGSCQYGSHTITISDEAGNTESFDTQSIGCDSNTSSDKYISWTYNKKESTTLTINISGGYCPFLEAKACELQEEPETPGEPTETIFRDFAAIINNQAGTLLAAEEQTQGTDFNFGIAVAADGTVSRVAADAADAVATLAGKYHSEHGATGLVATAKVDGCAKITIGQCTYSGAEISVKDAAGNVVASATPEKACWKNSKDNVTVLYYKGEATTLTITGMLYCPYVAIEAIEESAIPSERNITFALGNSEAQGVLPAAAKVEIGKSIVIPANTSLYKEGFTLTAWNDGKADYQIGAEYTPAADATLTPVFKANSVSLADRDGDVTIVWNFGEKNGATACSFEGKAGFMVAQATVVGNVIDVKIDIDGTSGKFYNKRGDEWAQVTNGVIFTLPSCKGATLSLSTYNAISATTVNGVAAEGNTEKTYTTTIESEAATAVVEVKDGGYYSAAQIVLPFVSSSEGEPTETTFRNFAVIVNNQAGTLLTTEEQIQGTNFSFGITVADDGTVSRVAADDPASIATISGTFHSEHGATGLAVTTKVDGPVKISVGQCTYSSADIQVKNEAGEVVASVTPATTCWKNDKSTAVVEYNGAATTLTITGMQYCPYVAVEKIETPAEPEEPEEPETPATSFEDAAATFAWAIGNETETTVDKAVANALSMSKYKVGSSLTTAVKTYTNNSNSMVEYTPGDATGCESTTMVEYSVKLQKGLTLKVSDVSFDAIKVGTDNAFFSWSYAIDGQESDIKAYSSPKTQILRDAKSTDAPLNHVETVEGEGRQFALRFYISDASGKSIALSNIKINGVINGEIEQRKFVDFALDFRTDPYSGTLPEGVSMTGGTWHDDKHGYSNVVLQVPVDGPVAFKIGSCQYGSKAVNVKDAEGNVLATFAANNGGCDSNTSKEKFISWTYNEEEAAVLTFELGEYCPFFEAAACEKIESCEITYFNTDGKAILSETVLGGSALAFNAEAAEKVTVKEGYKFRGWFNSVQSAGLKIKEGIAVQEDLKLYAIATPIEEVSPIAHYNYDLRKANFYVEDHECISVNGGKWHDGQHGFDFGNGGSISLPVAGKAYISVGCCRYSAESEAIVTDAEGKEIEKFQVKTDDGSDGAAHTIKYDGPATTLTITFAGTTYIHNVTVSNVVDFIAYNEATGYLEVPANDVNSFLIALTEANASGNKKIFLPNGRYDLGDICLTSISGDNISIIGESMEGTVIVNAPAIEFEGIGTTATLLNQSKDLYLQDLTLQNALDYYKTSKAGRAVCLQDMGGNTIAKNVRMLSYQDTYYSNAASNFYWEDSEIHGTVDYLCGDGNVVCNRVTLVNESRKADSKNGSDVICAPNCTATTQARTNWGYVFLDCSIESKCQDFTFARSWGGESKATFIGTTVKDGSLNENRFTPDGMNIAAYSFKEFGTKDAEGNVITPASNVMNFTHSTGNKEYETVLTAEEAAQYTIENIFGEWAPDKTAAQLPSPSTVEAKNGKLSWSEVAGATAYAVVADGKIIEIVSATTTSCDVPEAEEYGIRVANSRGGFGDYVPVKASVSDFMITLSSVGMATIYLDNNAEVPAGISAYAVSIDSENMFIVLTPSEIINAGMGYVLMGEEGKYAFTMTEQTSDIESELKGTLEDISVADYLNNESPKYSIVCTLGISKKNGQPGFFGYTGTLKANKAFLPIREEDSEAIAGYRIVYADEIENGETAIDAIANNGNADAIFNLQGQKIDNMTKGFYIINGKKVIVK